MPIDEFMLTPLISPYEDMIKDVDSKAISNDYVDGMKQYFMRLQELGQEYSDITTFMGVCLQEDLFGKLGVLYSKALTSHASENADNPSNYDDAALLKQSIDSLKYAIDVIRKNKEESIKEAGVENILDVETLDNSEDLIKPIEELIALGEKYDITFPDFLRLQIEQGLDKAIEGNVSTRKGLVYLLEWDEVRMLTPHHISRSRRCISVFDDLSNKQKFGVPNWIEFKWARNDINYEFEHKIIKWENITDRWNKILEDLHEWSLAYCSHARSIDPWNVLSESQKTKAIQKAKDTLPGIITQREQLLRKYFGITFQEIFTHETFLWEVKTNSIYYSKEFVDFIKDKVYPVCIPLQHMPNELITEREQISKENREINPKIMEPAVRIKSHYDHKFGEGSYTSKFGVIETIGSNAAPWN
ncbi:MAG: hypothetical protein AB8B74_02530 [Crocinitomicaceae bacterium]